MRISAAPTCTWRTSGANFDGADLRSALVADANWRRRKSQVRPGCRTVSEEFEKSTRRREDTKERKEKHMEITFLGGADEVGASSLLIEIAGRRLLVDAGIRPSPKARWGLAGDQLPDLSLIERSGRAGRHPGHPRAHRPYRRAGTGQRALSPGTGLCHADDHRADARAAPGCAAHHGGSGWRRRASCPSTTRWRRTRLLAAFAPVALQPAADAGAGPDRYLFSRRAHCRRGHDRAGQRRKAAC